ncbi:tetratricopeptide repeat protein [Trichocoleus sp. DQ-U1]|uniref:CHAT domain-containing protein n=1 Tax=Trichocoleus sp. DQ-U1 TaxID=2933926 RepID=UPI0032999C9C
MQPGRIGITALIALLAATTTAFVPNFPLSFAAQPALAQTSANRKAEADRLREEGNQQLDTSQFQAALQSYQQALAIYKEIGDKEGEADCLNNLGRAYNNLGQYQKAIEFSQQSLVMAREIGSRQVEAKSLRNLGVAYGSVGQYQKAIEFYQQSLAIAREIGDSQQEARSLGNLGAAYNSLGQYQKAIEFYQQSLAIAREIDDGQQEARSLGNLGAAYNSLGQYQKAIEFHQQSLAIKREIGDRSGEADSLGGLGSAYHNLGQYQKAIEFHQQSLAIAREIGDRSGEAGSLGGLGSAYNFQGQYQKAIEFHQQSLAMAREIGDRSGEGASLGNLGSAYFFLGQYQKVIEFYQQWLAIAREIGDRSGEAASLGNLGMAYRNLGQYRQAIEFYQQSLAIAQEIGDRLGESRSLGSLGNAYYSLGQYRQAIEFHQQSLAMAREIGDRLGESRSLGSLGAAYDSLGQYQKAIEFHQQSLAIKREIGDHEGEGIALNNIGLLLAKQNQPELAIIFYKQSVNVREAIRQDIRGLSKEQQQSYTESIAYTYRNLADLLLKQDRILEAQRVLDLLKVQELEDYLNNVRGSDNSAQGIASRAPEQQLKQGYDAILNQAIEQGKELAQLETIPISNRTESQKQRVIELRKNQQQLVQQFQIFLKSPEVAQLVAQLKQTTGGEGLDLDKYANNLQDNLKRLQQDAVILYPFVLDDRLELILITPYSSPIRRTVAVRKEELNQTIVDFRTSLNNATTDAKTPAQKLYNWLIKPLENDLTQAKAKTIIYAPDGQLRYIPLAALYDGNQWLVQRFGINNITALSLTEFNTKPQAKLQILAGAFTTGSYNFQIGNESFNFSGLKYAGVEVENLGKTVTSTTQVVDKQFNQGTILQMNDYSVVHLATHAAFVTGKPEESFILFGDGSRATLRDVGSWRLPNVDLIVLSACETGLGDKLGDGKEVLGFGYQMQQTGARAAIASLWQVNDGGTQSLMNAFYAALEKGNITKAEALRQAQIALITGDYKALGEQRGLGVQEVINSSLPADVSSRLGHPFYWAPFILIGNGL